MAHVYHWKHGWIPLDHTAALKKAKGNHHAAKKYLEAAHSKDAGIHSKEHVVGAAKSVRGVDPKDRGGAVRQVQSAAAKHGVDLPGSKKPVTPAKKAAAPAPGKPTSRYQVSRGPDGGAEITASNAASGGHSKIGRVIALPNGKYGAFHLAMHAPTTKHNTEEEAIKAVTDSHSSWKDPAKKRPVPKRTKSGHETTTPADYTVSPGSGGSRIVNGPYGDVVGRVDRTGDGKYTATDHEGHKTVHNSKDAAENYVIFQHDASLPRKGDAPVSNRKSDWKNDRPIGEGNEIVFPRSGGVKAVPTKKKAATPAKSATPAVASNLSGHAVGDKVRVRVAGKAKEGTVIGEGYGGSVRVRHYTAYGDSIETDFQPHNLAKPGRRFPKDPGSGSTGGGTGGIGVSTEIPRSSPANQSQRSAFQSAADEVMRQYQATVSKPSATPAEKAAAKSIAKRKIKEARSRYQIDGY